MTDEPEYVLDASPCSLQNESRADRVMSMTPTSTISVVKPIRGNHAIGPQNR